MGLCSSKHIAGKLYGTLHLALRKGNSTVFQAKAHKSLLLACTLTGIMFIQGTFKYLWNCLCKLTFLYLAEGHL